jgi:putative tryptophan/tyrosine transport system substrate-binding protein
MTKILTCLLLTLLLLTVSIVDAQQPKKVPRIGYLSGRGDPSTPDPLADAFRQGLRDLGYIEGKNILVEYRYAEGKLDRIPSLVAELVQLKVDVLVSPTLPAIRAAKQTTKTIPIVMLTNVDPVATGIVDSLARPGGNITGLARFMTELSGKRLELLKEVVPKISHVGVLWDADDPDAAIGFKEYEAAARALKIQLQSLEVRGPNPDLEGAFQAAAKGRASALITVRNLLLLRYPKRIADLAIKNRLPSMYEGSDFVETGGLMSYSSSDAESFRRAATYVDKILKGAKPADLPVEQPTKFEFIINLKAAKQIGLTIPPNVLARADRVIRWSKILHIRSGQVLDFRLPIFDYGKNLMHNTLLKRFLNSCSDNRKSKIQNRKWAGLFAIVVALTVCEARAEAQPAKIPRIGHLNAPSLSALAARTEAFRQGLRALGYLEGKNIVIEDRYAEGKLDRLPALAAELVRLKVDIIVSTGPSVTRAAKEATSTIPIVMAFDTDPVGNGFVASLARPGGNITGLSTLAPEISGKQLELLKEIVPKLSRVAVFGTSTTPGSAQALREMGTRRRGVRGEASIPRRTRS